MNAQNDVNFIITALSDIIARLQGNTAPKSSLTFGEWLKEWYPLYVRPSLRETTAFTYELYLFRYIIPALGELRLHEVDERTLQRYLTGIKNGNTRKKQAFLINRALRKAVALGMLHKNPFFALELPKYHSRHYRQLEFDEQNAIFAKSASRPEYQALFFVLCCTGLRIGECLALDFNRDVDEKNGIIHVTKTIDIHTGEIYNRTKTLPEPDRFRSFRNCCLRISGRCEKTPANCLTIPSVLTFAALTLRLTLPKRTSIVCGILS